MYASNICVDKSRESTPRIGLGRNDPMALGLWVFGSVFLCSLLQSSLWCCLGG